MSIRFSIIVPVYNVEKYVDECVKSVLNQTYKNYELILVDDGSTDNSGIICDQYAKEYHNIQTYHKKNGGQLHTRLYGMSRATGDYYVFLDSDDMLKTEALETIFDAIEKYDSDCVIYGLELVQDGNAINRMCDKHFEIISDKRKLYKKCFATDAYNSMCRKAVKASVIKNIDYSDSFHLRLGEDLLQSVEILKNCTQVVFLNTCLYDYRVNFNSVTHSIKYENFKVDFSVRKYIFEFLKRENLFDENDWNEYITYQAMIFVDTIKLIARFDTSLANKITLYKEIKRTDYYGYLNSGKIKISQMGKAGIIYRLFKSGLYPIMVAIIRVYKRR